MRVKDRTAESVVVARGPKRSDEPADFGQLAAGDRDWIARVYDSDPRIRMQLVRDGVPAQAVQALAESLDMSREYLTAQLGLARATVERKLRKGERLGKAESESVLGIVRLIGQAQRIVDESGDPTNFDAALWIARWIETPLPALGGDAPITYMDTAEGRDIVSRILAQIQSGAYA